MITIFIEKSTSRLQYTVNLVFKTVLKVDYILIHDKQVFANLKSAKVSYCNEKIANEVHFFATEFLSETTIKKQIIDLKKIDGLPTFFQHNKNAALPYDPFAMIFYLVSRYEEYTESQRDKHGRFRASLSLAHQYNFLKIPLVNHLCLKIKSFITTKYPLFNFPKQSFRFLPTYDIDYAWAYLNRNLKRTLGGYAQAVVSRQPSIFWDRLQVQFGFKKDPFDVFDFLDDLHQTHELSPIYFFLIGDYSLFDKNIHYQNAAFCELIKRLSAKYDTGLHPSYLSNSVNGQLEKEKKRLDNIVQQETIRSRQHFLKLEIPRTYQRLLAIGIKEDYTMGYATEIGFRASIATPYFWYDLEHEKATDLLITPFQVMDVTLKEYLNLSPEAALAAVKVVVTHTKAVNGVFSTLWHNSSFDERTWKGWQSMYLELNNWISKL